MKIGVTFSESNYANYLLWIKVDDSTIEIINLLYESNSLNDVTICDGLVCTGGIDIDTIEKTDDGVIEVIESSNPEEQFLFAVQWHPERMINLESPFSKNIRRALIEKIKKSEK